MRAVDDTEDIVTTDESETRPSTLKVVDGLSHVALGTEDQGRKSILCDLDLFGFNYLIQSVQDFSVGQASVSKDCTAGLERLDDFVGLITGKCESSGV